MKKIISTTFFMFLAIFTLVTINSCNKKSDETPYNSSPQYRVTQSSYYKNGNLNYKELVEYKENKISALKWFDINETTGQLELSSKIDFTYLNGSKVIIVGSYLSSKSGIWENNWKYEASFANGRITESINYDYNVGWDPKWKFNCLYSGENMTQMIVYSYNAGNWQNDQKWEIEYSGSHPTQSIFYAYETGWNQHSKDIFSYSGTVPDNITDYKFDGAIFNQTNRHVLVYDNNLISKISDYFYSNGTWNGSGYTTYEYDSNGNLTAEILVNKNFDSDRIEYNYEAGQGNYRQIEDIWEDDEYLNNHIYPHAVK